MYNVAAVEKGPTVATDSPDFSDFAKTFVLLEQLITAILLNAMIVRQLKAR